MPVMLPPDRWDAWLDRELDDLPDLRALADVPLADGLTAASCRPW